MPCCVAYGCGTKPQKGKRMHRFPRDPNRRKMWESKVRRKNWKSNTDSFLCEDHFDEAQYESRRIDGLRRLKPNAVPTQFLTSLKHPDKPRPQSRKVLADAENIDGWATVTQDHSYSSPSPSLVIQAVDDGQEDNLKEAEEADFKDDLSDITSGHEDLDKTHSVHEITSSTGGTGRWEMVSSEEKVKALTNKVKRLQVALAKERRDKRKVVREMQQLQSNSHSQIHGGQNGQLRPSKKVSS